MRKKLIDKMVNSFYNQAFAVRRFGVKNQVTLREYLQEIKDKSSTMTQEEVEYGCLIQSKKENNDQ